MTKIYKAISLFSGAGGMDVGFKRAGIQVVLANEIIKDTAETYKYNHPDSLMVNDDINNILESLDDYNDIDIVFGGPPCQGFSVAGKMDPNDERSKLIFTFLDAIERINPKIFVMENVKALGFLEKWENVRKKYLNRVWEMGYTCVPFILNATDYGVAQKRERVFFIGIKNCTDAFFEYHMLNILESKKSQAPNIRSVLQPLGRAGTSKNPHTCTAKITFAANPVMRKSPFAGMYFNGQGRPIDIDGYANTLPASMGGNKTPFIDEEYLYGNAEEDWIIGYHNGLMQKTILPEAKEAPNRLRRITIKEAALIQTFPDNYIFVGSKGAIYTQIGNAVPCKLAEAVAKSVIEYVESN